MAVAAPGLAIGEEQRSARAWRIRLIASWILVLTVAIERRPERHDRSHEGRQRRRHVRRRHRVGVPAERLRQTAACRSGRQPAPRRRAPRGRPAPVPPAWCRTAAPATCVFQRAKRRVRPGQGIAVGGVDERHRAARVQHPGGAEPLCTSVGERLLLEVTGAARLGAVPRESRVVEKAPSQLHACRRHRPFRGDPWCRHSRRQIPLVLRHGGVPAARPRINDTPRAVACVVCRIRDYASTGAGLLAYLPSRCSVTSDSSVFSDVVNAAGRGSLPPAST